MRPLPDPTKTRQRWYIAEKVKAYLASGGQIERVPSGIGAEARGLVRTFQNGVVPVRVPE